MKTTLKEMETTDLIVKDEGQFWGMNVKTASKAGELFSNNYFNGLIKRNFYVPNVNKDYFVDRALSCGLTVLTIK